MATIAFLSIATTALCALLISAETCTNSQIGECDDLIGTVIADPGQVFQSHGDPEFSQFCREVDEYKTCVDRFYHSCDKTTQVAIDSVMKGEHYICYEGKQKYLEHHECYGGAALNTEAETCIKRFSGQASNITSRLQLQPFVSDEEKNSAVDELCSVIEVFKACVHTAVEKHCGTDAADLQDHVITRMYNFAETFGGCSPMSLSHMKWIIIASVAAVAVVISCIAIVVRNHLRKRRSAGVENSFNNPLASSYNPPKYEV